MAHFKLGDITLYYDLKGGGKGGGDETVVFANGLTMTAAAWAEVEPHFASRYRTLLYDCRGQGGSDKPPGPYTPEGHAADLIALLDGLGLERVHLVGHSNGGLLSALAAAELAQRSPGRVMSLSLVASFLRLDPLLRATLASWRAALDAGGPTLRFDVAAPWVWGRSFLETRGDELERYRDAASQADPQVIGWLIDGLLSLGDARKALRAYGGPVLAAVGQDDLLTPLRMSHEIVEWANQGILVTIDRAGHGVPIERPEALARVVRGFLERRDEAITPL